MNEKSRWQSRETEASNGALERFKNSKIKRRLLGYTAGLALALGLGGVDTQTADAKVFKAEKMTIPKEVGYEGAYRKLPRYRKYASAVEARNEILSQYDTDRYSMTPPPAFDKYTKEFYKSCVYGILGYPVSSGNGDFRSGRVDDDTVAMDVFAIDDCGGYRQSTTIVGMESRENSQAEFETVMTPPGIVKRFASSPEYGSEYFGAFNMEETCTENPDLEVRFTMENVTRNNWLPVAIKVRAEKNLPIIKCD